MWRNRLVLFAILFLIISLITVPFSSSPTFASHDKLMKWKLAFITESGDCAEIDKEAMFWFQRVTEIYLNKYQVNQEMRDLDCINHYKIQEEDFSFADYDLIIFAPVLSLKDEYMQEKGHRGEYWYEGNENTIVSLALQNSIHNVGFTWTLSHELSHFVLKWKGYPNDIVGGAVEKIEIEYRICFKNDPSLSECPQLWDIITTTDREEKQVMKIITTEDYQPEKTQQSTPEQTTPKQTIPEQPIPEKTKLGEVPTPYKTLVRLDIIVMDEYSEGTIKVFPRLKDIQGKLISNPEIYIWIDGIGKGWTEPNNWSKSFWVEEGSHKIEVATTPFQYGGNHYQSLGANRNYYTEERPIAEERPLAEEITHYKHKNTYLDTKLLLEAKHGTKKDHVIIYPLFVEDDVYRISTSMIQLFINGYYRATLTSNQWSDEFYAGELIDGYYNISADVAEDPYDTYTLYMGIITEEIKLKGPSKYVDVTPIYEETITPEVKFPHETKIQLDKIVVQRNDLKNTINDLDDGINDAENALTGLVFQKKEAQEKINRAWDYLKQNQHTMDTIDSHLIATVDNIERNNFDIAQIRINDSKDFAKEAGENLLKISELIEEAKELEKQKFCFLWWCW